MLWLLFVGLGAVLVGPVVYWLVSRGFDVSRTLRVATVVSALLVVAPLLALVVLISGFLGWFWTIVIVLGFFLFQYLLGPRLVLTRSYVRRPMGEERWVVEALEEVKKAARYEKPIELYIARDPLPNAFAVSNAFRRAVVLNEGLLDLVKDGVLDREAVKAIIAHEVGHIAHRDNTYALAVSLTPYMVYAVGFGLFTFGVLWLKYLFVEEDANPLLGIAGVVVGGILLLLAALVNIGVLGFLRMREHLADVFAVKTTGSLKIAEALVTLDAFYEVLREKVGLQRGKDWRPDVRKMLYIVPMAYGELFGFVGFLLWSSPFSTHPPTDSRVYIVEKYYRNN